MKRTAFIIGLGLTLLACSRIEIEQAPEPIISKEICFTAYYPDLETKTERQGKDSNGNYPVYWCPGDAVSLFFNKGDHGGDRFVAQNTEVSAIAEFKGTITGFAGGGESTGGEFWFWGVYPYSEDNSCDGSSVTITLPAQQTAKAGNFANGLFPTMAKSQGLSLGFYNICGGFKFTVSRDDIKAVKFRGNADEELAGKAKVVWDSNGHPAVSEHLVGEKEVTVTAPNNGTFVPGIEYYIVFYPELLSNGFTMTFITSTAKQGCFSYTNSRQIQRGIFITGPNLDTYVTSWTDAEDSSGQDPGVAGGGTKSGLYLGIIGFNDDLYKMDIERLDANSKTRFDDFINGLTTKNGTLLYYSVDQSLNTLKQAQYPDDLYSASLVTFTDGLDMGSAMMIDNYTTDDECLESLHSRLSVSSFSGIPLTSYSIGLMGSDVKTTQQIEMFRKNLKKLSYPENNAYEVNDMASVNARFQEIADKISQTTSTTKYNLELTIPGKASGTVWRFTLDGATSAESSTMYIEGTFNLSTKALTNVTYHGMTCSSGSTIQGVVNGIHITYTFSDIIPDAEKTLSKDKVWTWYYVQSSSDFWQGNTEFSQDEDVDIIVIQTKQSVVVFLNLDSSTSLDNQFTTLKNYAKSFVSTLYNASFDPNAIDAISLNKTYVDLIIGQNETLQATISPSTASGNTLVWSSAIPSVATVDQNGKVTAVSEGTTIISVSTEDGKEMATCTVTVRFQHVESISLDKSNLQMYVGKTATLVATVSPSNANNPAVTWTSSNPTVANVSSNGVVTAYTNGTTVITATSADGGKTASCTITVSEYVPSSDPVDLSLVVKCPSRSGFPDIGYISYEDLDYVNLDEYGAIGLAVLSESGDIVIALEDAASYGMDVSNAIYYYKLPTKAQGVTISARWVEINNALKHFGASSFNSSDYWTQSKSSGSYYYYISGSGGSLTDGNCKYSKLIREVLPLNQASPDCFVTKSKGIYYTYIDDYGRHLVETLNQIPAGNTVEGIAVDSSTGVGRVILSLDDASASSMTWSAASSVYGANNLPNKEQALLISARFFEINKALNSCGGTEMISGRYYWTSKSESGSSYYYYCGAGCYLSSTNSSCYVRLIKGSF